MSQVPGFEVLKENVVANGFYKRVRLSNEAVWRSSGTLALLRVSSLATTAFASSASDGETFSSKAVGLDEVVGRCARNVPALVKIDTEGAEAEILEGASNASLARIAQLVIEYHDFRVPGSLSRCQSVLASNGFRCIVRPTGVAVGLLYALRPTL
jgi:FkbM family methyltransferase